ncbi:hypothetical protein SAMN02745355_1619 [Picrophilus oshimae DSM 9789]|uniref:Mut7-C RNAse domain-containing protein n=3 Tax=Picrophilus oshimae TaxID=46632 RepID=A0A8G2FY51_PICTO|nr:hypothetical protein SAMN02745355_1619 [Picrophilus oshimae DSM 9789]
MYQKDGNIEFMADHMLKRACEWMRFLGYTVYYPECHYDNDILKTCIEKKLVLLTRDIELYKRYALSVYIDSVNINEQIIQITRQFPPDPGKFMTKCPDCGSDLILMRSNGLDIPDKIKKSFSMVRYCNKCSKAFWPGTHYIKIIEKINRLLK